MSSNITTTSPPTGQIEKNVLSEGVVISGLVLMSMVILLAMSFAIWVLYYCKSPVVKAMQPLFLILLCVGTVISSLAIIPLSANDENYWHSDIDAACLAQEWLRALGSTITLAALFSKLWRVNQIFHAEGFQRKVVTVRDVLQPFLILLLFNLLCLIILSVADPPVWVYEPIIDDDLTSVWGHCEAQGTLGRIMIALLDMIQFVCLVLLCIQAYRARDVRTEFSEARGVALALFSALQIFILVFPMEILIDPENTDALYMLKVLSDAIQGVALLLFIFCPIIAHHMDRQGRESMGTRVTGIDTHPAVVQSPASHSGVDELKQAHGRIQQLEEEVNTLRLRLQEMTGEDSQTEEEHGAGDASP